MSNVYSWDTVKILRRCYTEFGEGRGLHMSRIFGRLGSLYISFTSIPPFIYHPSNTRGTPIQVTNIWNRKISTSTAENIVLRQSQPQSLRPIERQNRKQHFHTFILSSIHPPTTRPIHGTIRPKAPKNLNPTISTATNLQPAISQTTTNLQTHPVSHFPFKAALPNRRGAVSHEFK